MKGQPHHGHAARGNVSPEYNTWFSMKQRCLSPSHKGYARYGGRGITVCERWKISFANFLEDMGSRPTGCTLERENTDGNYEPGNCRWATDIEQANNKVNNRFLTVGGVSKTVAQWAREKGMNVASLHSRLNKGWSEEDAVNKPLRGKK